MPAPYFAYGATELTNSDYSLEALSTKNIRQNDIAVVVEDDKIYFFRSEASSGVDHNPPYVIKPVDETNDKRWLLVSQKNYTTDIIQLVDKHIQTGHIKAISDNTIEIEASNGSKIIINQNGVVNFPSYVHTSLEPTNDSHLTNKSYVDDQYQNKKDELESYIDVLINDIKQELKDYTDNLFETKRNELESYSDSYIDTEIEIKDTSIKSYIDTEINTIETNLKNYVDSEYLRIINSVYPVLKFNIDTWNTMNGLYYNDIEHNKGFNEVIVRCWNDNEILYPDKIEALDANNIRIWMTEEITLKVLVV